MAERRAADRPGVDALPEEREERGHDEHGDGDGGGGADERAERRGSHGVLGHDREPHGGERDGRAGEQHGRAARGGGGGHCAGGRGAAADVEPEARGDDRREAGGEAKAENPGEHVVEVVGRVRGARRAEHPGGGARAEQAGRRGDERGGRGAEDDEPGERREGDHRGGRQRAEGVAAAEAEEQQGDERDEDGDDQPPVAMGGLSPQVHHLALAPWLFEVPARAARARAGPLSLKLRP